MTPKIQIELAWVVPGRVTSHKIAADCPIESCAKYTVAKWYSGQGQTRKRRPGKAVGQVPGSVQEITNRDSRSVKKTYDRASNKYANTNYLCLPSVCRDVKIGGETKVKGSNYDKKRGPKYKLPSSLEHSSKDENTSGHPEQTDGGIQNDYDEAANELGSRLSSSYQVLQ